MTHIESETTVALDIKIVSSNPQTLSYPFDVEVTLKKFLVSEIQQDDQSSTVISYDSDSLRTLENYVLAEHLDKLISHPLRFRIEGDFQIKEMTGYLDQIDEDFNSPFDEDFNSPSILGLFGTTQWSFELILTQLFHLSGQNLLSKKSYPTSCYQFLNWEDEALDEQEINIDQSSDYIISNMDSKNIEATWQGNAKVTNTEVEDGYDGHVSVEGNVIWDCTNPLIQKRDLKAEIKETQTGFYSSHVKLSVQQTWEATSLD